MKSTRKTKNAVRLSYSSITATEEKVYPISLVNDRPLVVVRRVDEEAKEEPILEDEALDNEALENEVAFETTEEAPNMEQAQEQAFENEAKKEEAEPQEEAFFNYEPENAQESLDKEAFEQVQKQEPQKEEEIKLDPIQDEQKPKKKGFRLSLTEKRSLSGWLFVLPFVIGILFVYGPIIISSITFTFVDNKSIFSADGYEFVGFANYANVFKEYEWFSDTIVDAMQDLILQIPAIVIFSLFMAIILNQKMTGRAVFRAIFFLPVILSTGIIDALDVNSSLMDSMQNSQGGIDDNTGGANAGGIVSALDIEMLLSNIKLGTDLVKIVTDLVNDIFDIVSRSGVQMLIFLSGLQSISPAIYESCEVEGASAWETFWKITLPMISPMILVNAVYTIIDLFTSADNRVMQAVFGGYGSVYYHDTNYAMAGVMMWLYIIIVLAVIVLVALLLKSVVFYQRRD
ncbi:MAG: ABC transporter permease subunit [Clostridia bacterium]|nr:ABC transporter permease subunit [Clostridia bacterium]